MSEVLSFESDDQKLLVGLSWEPNEEQKGSALLGKRYIPHDVDVSCALYDAAGGLIDHITPTDAKRDQYKQLVFHSGDHTTGGSDFEDEDIQIWLGRLPETIASVAVFVSTKGELQFHQVNALKIQMMDGVSLQVFAETDLSAASPFEGSDYGDWQYCAYVLKRDGAGWVLAASDVYGQSVASIEKYL